MPRQPLYCFLLLQLPKQLYTRPPVRLAVNGVRGSECLHILTRAKPDKPEEQLPGLGNMDTRATQVASCPRLSQFPFYPYRLGLGMHSQLLIAAVRCVVQLSLLGHILVPIFDYGQLWLVLAYAAFMVWVSAVEAIGRPARFYKVGHGG